MDIDIACATRAITPLVARVSELTHVELLWVKKRFENWIRFGHIEEEHRLDPQWRVVSFAAGASSLSFAGRRMTTGRSLSRIDIMRAVGPGERYSTVPYVRPGAESLLRVSGWPKVEKVLQAIDVVQALDVDPADAAPDHWRHVHNRLFVGQQPRPYTLSRHQAWLHRRKFVP